MTALASESPTRAVAPGLTYVPALDGIRALAVLAVMTYHFGGSWLPGGFIGVDVFFVLSGFLITTLLVEASPGRFSLARFWLRRGRRLFPALALMLMAVCVYALTTPVLEQSTIRGQGVATLFYVNNWWLLHTGVSYFDAYQSPSPLLHTWSLSVEEQWYIVFPLLLTVVAILKHYRLKVVGALCAVLAIGSVVWTALLARTSDPDRLYLGTDTRAQQLLIGALLGVIGVAMMRRHGDRIGRLRARDAAVLGWAGLMGLGGMAALWREQSGMPAQLLLSSVFAALLIVGALSPVGGLSQLLSWEPLRRIGVISYGLYLWHWPISVIIDENDTNAPTVLRIVLTFAAASVSYAILERPLRRWPLRQVGILLAALPLPLIALILVCTPKAGEADTLAELPEQAAFEYHGDGVRVFVVGDSVGGSLWQPVWLNPRSDVAVTGSLLLGCPPIDLEFLQSDGAPTELGPPPGTSCEAWLGQWRDDIKRLRPDALVLVASSQLQFDVTDGGPQQAFASQGYKDLMFKTLDRSFAGLEVPHIFITSPPCTALGSNAINDAKNDRDRTAKVRDILWEYAQDRGYGVIDLAARTCFGDPSDLYMDGIHFSKRQALSMWDWIAPQLVEQVPARSASTVADTMGSGQ